MIDSSSIGSYLKVLTFKSSLCKSSSLTSWSFQWCV